MTRITEREFFKVPQGSEMILDRAFVCPVCGDWLRVFLDGTAWCTDDVNSREHYFKLNLTEFLNVQVQHAIQ